MGILAFIIILGVVIFVHEFGHFMAARRSGVTVEEFGFGFPPRLAAVKKGTTLYSINWIPFGGFVRMLGEDGQNNEQPGSFGSAVLWKQIIILLAGVFMNFVLAVVIMSAVLGVGVKVDPTTLHLDSLSIVSKTETQIATSAGGAADTVGLHQGDVLVSIDGRTMKTTDDLIAYLKQTSYPTITVVTKHLGVQLTRQVTPTDTSTGKKYGLGITTSATLRYPWYVTPWYGLKTTADVTWQSIKGFGTLVQGLSRGKVSSDVTGPIGIAVLTNEVSRFGIISLLQFAALLSVSLAVLNVLPLPALDGGRVFLRLLSGVMRRPINRQVEGAIHTIGFYLLVVFLIYISARDVQRYNIFGQLIHWFQ